MHLLYEDDYLLVAVKEPGMLSEQSEHKDSFPFILKNELSLTELPHPVHRLDREVGGAMLFAKNSSAMAACARTLSEGAFHKEYLAVTEGKPLDLCACLSDLLLKIAAKNKTFVVDRVRKGVKDACLSYRTLGYTEYENQPLSLLSVTPHTGRTHQIRVQLASRRLPLTGDRKYGGKLSMPLGLFCRSLRFVHPYTKKEIVCVAPLPNVLPFSLCFKGADGASFTSENEPLFSDFRHPRS